MSGVNQSSALMSGEWLDVVLVFLWPVSVEQALRLVL